MSISTLPSVLTAKERLSPFTESCPPSAKAVLAAQLNILAHWPEASFVRCSERSTSVWGLSSLSLYETQRSMRPPSIFVSTTIDVAPSRLFNLERIRSAREIPPRELERLRSCGKNSLQSADIKTLSPVIRAKAAVCPASRSRRGLSVTEGRTSFARAARTS